MQLLDQLSALCSQINVQPSMKSVINFTVIMHQIRKKKNAKKRTPARANAPLMNTSHNSVVLVLKEKRLECIQLRKRIENINKELEKSSIYLTTSLTMT